MSIINGATGTSIFQEKYKPKVETIAPGTKPIIILFVQLLLNKAENAAGKIKNAKTVRISLIFTASIITIPKVR